MARGIKVTAEEFWARCIPEPNTGCWLWLGDMDPDGYGRARLWGLRGRRAPRIAYVLANGGIPAGLQILHRCDVRACVNPDHLFVGTGADNMADKTRKGRQTRGDDHASAVLSGEIVRVLRAEFAEARRVPLKRLAARYGVSRNSIFRAIRGQTWRSL
jgi:hypothetical protein